MYLTRNMRARQEFYYLGRVLRDGEFFQATDDDASYFLKHRKAEDVVDVFVAFPVEPVAEPVVEPVAEHVAEPVVEVSQPIPPTPRRRGRPRST